MRENLIINSKNKRIEVKILNFNKDFNNSILMWKVSRLLKIANSNI